MSTENTDELRQLPAGIGNIACLGATELIFDSMRKAEGMGASQSEVVLALALVLGAIIRVQEPDARKQLAKVVWNDVKLAAGLGS